MVAGLAAGRPLTPRQRQVLEFVRAFTARTGRPPTYRAIGAHLGIGSPHGVRKHLLALQRRGLLALHPSRGIEFPPAVHERLFGLRLVGHVPAGHPWAAEELAGEIVTLPDWFGGGALFALRVGGESMVEAGIHDGDVVVVRPGPVGHGQIAVVLVDGEATVKRLERCRGGIRLVGAHPRHPPIEVRAGGGREVRVVGRVVGLLRRIP